MAVNKPDPVRNLGHKSTEARLTRNPAPRVVDYTQDGAGQREIKEGQRHTQGVYGRHSPTPRGISTQENLDKWASYSRSNSYHGRDPRGCGEGSDDHLLSTKGWANLPDSGSESGPGRIEKAKRY
jgi:hypothetical protein